MVNILIFSLGVGVLGSIIAALGGFYFVISVRTLTDGNVKRGLFFIFFASFIWIIYSSLMIYFVFIDLDLKNNLWIIIPIGYATTAVFFNIGTYKLMRSIRDIQEQSSKRLDVNNKEDRENI